MRVRQAPRRPVMLGNVQQRRHRPDYMLLVLSTVLLMIGLIVIYAISPGLSAQKHVSENYYVSKQFIAIGLGVVAFLITANLPLSIWRRLQTPLIIFAAGASLAVRLFGERVNGAYRWIQIGGISFQAVELVKFALLVWLASFLVQRLRQGQMGDNNQTLRPLLIALIIIGVVVAWLQSDLGSMGVIIAMMVAMSFVVGLPLRRVAIFGGIILIGIILAISSSPYRRDRLLTFLHPQRDCQNAGYQACQALIAVGSGGLFGKGLAHDVQAYGYLPEAANDSIFAIVAEKFGFVGVTVLITLFMVFFTRLKNIMERAPDDFSRLLIVGVLAWFSTQTIINIGAMIGLLPLKGITLPFISYGGTSVVFVTAAVGLAFNISRYTTYTATLSSEREDYENPRLRRGDGRPRHAYLSRRA
ncbi:MAG TPA: putative peptidoglycan glycosyltransferase FtsW [Candidatus Saccharimonadales bacterium]|nr:putative peptidoglycan glycosyltransferase FtsW [Candidatus Saccharimonadales bacterium]